MPLAVAVVLGFLLLAVGAVLTVPLPELGLPLLAGGLRLLGRRYGWAARCNDRLDAVVARIRGRWRRSSRTARVVVVTLVVVVAAGVGWWAVAG